MDFEALNKLWFCVTMRGTTLTLAFVAAALLCFHCSRIRSESSRTTRRPMKTLTAAEAEDVSTAARSRPSEKRTATTTV